MNSAEVRAKLLLYRPAVDAEDPQFAEALAQAARDPELKRWLDARLAADSALSEKLRAIEPPPDLAARIIRERPVPFAPSRQAKSWLQLAAALVVLAGVAVFWLRPAPRNRFAAYEEYLGRLVTRDYRMSLETSDLEQIRGFLANNQAPADYVLAPPLTRTPALGCATLSWNGNPVSMLCFADAEQGKLFLFVVNRGAIPDAPASAEPELRQVGEFAVASWTAQGRAYVLAVKGGPERARKFL
jgi:hypothetical protein